MRGKNEKILTGCLFAAAAGLLVFSAAGTSQAALSYVSENYKAQFDLSDIGITLVENDQDISWRNYTGSDDAWKETTGTLLENMIDTENGEELIPGKTYPEALTVRNTGSMEQYARVAIRRYWADEETGEKKTMLDPDLIELNLTDSGWIEDENASTDERIVLYYSRILEPGETASLFADSLMIDPSVSSLVTEQRESSGGYTTITTSSDYDGARFVLDVEADAVQTHNAVEAIKSAWGVDVLVAEDGSLSLN
jgi:hypothetical protein